MLYILLFLILFFIVCKFFAGAALYVAGGVLGLFLVIVSYIIRKRRS